MSKRKSFLSLTGLVLLLGTAIYVLTSKLFQTTSAKTVLLTHGLVPEISCYPNAYKIPVKIDRYTYQGKTYSQTKSLIKTTSEQSLLYFETSPNGCRQLGTQTFGSRETFMPKKAALYFANLYVENIFAICMREKKNEVDANNKCKAKLEKEFNVPGNIGAEEPIFIHSDVAEVLNQRGIKTDKALIIKTAKDFELASLKEQDHTYGLKKCVKVDYPETVKKISPVQIKEVNVPTRGKRIYYNVDVELAGGRTTRHVYQTILLNSEYCQLFYAGSDIGVNPLSANAYSQEEARPRLLTWYKWKLKNVLRERERIQSYLNKPYPALAQEEYWTFSQLGFKMPKSYKLVQ